MNGPVIERARVIHKAGGIDEAITSGKLTKLVETSLAEALVLGLLKQGVKKYFAIFGHGSTHLGEVLRIYETEGVTQTFNFRNEVEMAHAATALRWQYGEIPAVITSIGPGALQSLAGSLVASSNGIGVYHIYGDETTHGEGYNMQQIPKPEQGLFGRLTNIMGESYVLHTPEAIRDAMRRGVMKVNHPYKAGPFFMLLPLNTQPQYLKVNLAALPGKLTLPKSAVADQSTLDAAVDLIRNSSNITIKAGGGSCGHDSLMRELAETIGAAVALTPRSTGILPDNHPQNMHVGGSKGSISGNFAMENADLVIVIGSRGVCQADSSGTAYKSAKAVININQDLTDLTHYNNTIALPGQIDCVVRQLLGCLKNTNGSVLSNKQEWLTQCLNKKKEWHEFKQARVNAQPIHDQVWGKPVLAQPAAIKTVADFAKSVEAVKLFDAGDVQANGFQVVEDDHSNETYTDTGASFMGFASSAITASGIAENPRYPIAFTGDGSFMMNPQVLISAVEHNARGMIVLFDNRRMAAITSLQKAQYQEEFKTNDSVSVDYVQLAGAVKGVLALYGGDTQEKLEDALRKAYNHDGLSLVHVPVYNGPDPLSEMGAYGSWNVGNWCDEVQKSYHSQDI